MNLTSALDVFQRDKLCYDETISHIENNVSENSEMVMLYPESSGYNIESGMNEVYGEVHMYSGG